MIPEKLVNEQKEEVKLVPAAVSILESEIFVRFMQVNNKET